MDDNEIPAFQRTFLTWYSQNKRDLPWRHHHDAYNVWLSEIMLQQTQVNTVIPYFLHFLETFPNLEALKNAQDDVLMKCWEGLGYYSRARNLKRGAQQLVNDYNGQFPQTVQGLTDIVGIGPYTAGAIASIAFNQPVPAVDGNAFRVFSRLFEDDTDISQTKARAHFETLIQPLIPEAAPGDFNQAVMDLGASFCTTKEPACLLCPIQKYCLAGQKGSAQQFPVKLKKIKKKKVQLAALVIQAANGAYLLQQRPKRGLLAGLYSFPLVDLADLPKDTDQDQALAAFFDSQYNLQITLPKAMNLKPVTHVFTHLHWTMTLMSAQVQDPQPDLAYFPGSFVLPQDFAAYPWPTLQKKLWKALDGKS